MIRRPGLASGRQSKNSLGELTEASGAVPVTVSPTGVVTPTRPKGIAPEPGARPRPGEASEPAVPPEEGAPTASTSRWVWVALGAGVLGLGGWYLLRARARAGKK